VKSQVYSWRVSADIKSGLEREARRRKMSVSAVLDLAAREWLGHNAPADEEEEQRRLQTAALKCFGAFAGGDGHRSENARRSVRRRLQRLHDR